MRNFYIICVSDNVVLQSRQNDREIRYTLAFRSTRGRNEMKSATTSARMKVADLTATLIFRDSYRGRVTTIRMQW
jgi:hypothetical protein